MNFILQIFVVYRYAFAIRVRVWDEENNNLNFTTIHDLTNACLHLSLFKDSSNQIHLYKNDTITCSCEIFSNVDIM